MGDGLIVLCDVGCGLVCVNDDEDGMMCVPCVLKFMVFFCATNACCYACYFC